MSTTLVKWILVGLVWVAPFGARSAEAMHATPAPTAAQLVARAAATDSTRRLLALSASYRDAARGERAAARRALRAAALERRRTLATLMESDPAGMLTIAIPEEVRRSLPAVVRGKVERDADLVGELEVLHVDDAFDSRFLYYVDTPGGRMAVFTAAELPPDATTGARVRVRGKRIGRALALDGATASSFQLLALALPNTIGRQATAVLLVNFQDNPLQPFTPSTAASVVFGNASSYDREVSYQQTWLEGAVYGWYTIALSGTVCDTSTLATQARSAAVAAGVDLSAFRRFVYVFPKNACTWAGLGTVGGNPSHAWLNGILNMTVVAHEMGHNLGLYHSHAFDCTSSPTSCASVEYGDILDVMGRSVSSHFNAFQKERLGWLGGSGTPPVTTVQATGSYPLDPFESTGSGPKALKVLKATDPATGARTWYYVELRRAIGFDASLAASPNIMGGVIVRTGSETSGNTSFLLDMTPETTTLSDPALVVGRTFSDAAAGISIKPTSVGDGGAVVAVTVGSTACVRGATTLTVSPQTVLAPAGGQGTAVVTIANGDSATCPASTVQLAPSAPAGWTASVTPTSTSVGPGDVATAELTLTVPPSTPPGDYGFVVAGTPSGSAPVQAPGTVDVASGLGVRVTTDRPTYSPSAYVFVTTLVTSGAAPAANATVVVTMTRPNGATVSRTLSTDAAGAAVTSFRLRRAAPGVYGLTAVATAATGGLTGTGQTTFAVQ